MKINRTTLAKNYIYEVEESIDFSSYELVDNVKSISDVIVKAKTIDYGNVLRIEVEISAHVVAICSYTLEDVDLPLLIKDELDFTDDPSLVEQYFIIDKPIFDLDPYILGLILSEVPSKVIKKGAKLPPSGKGYRVLTEEELEKERKSTPDSRWAKLDELEFDD